MAELKWTYYDASRDNGKLYRSAVDKEAKRGYCERWEDGEWVSATKEYGALATGHIAFHLITEEEAEKRIAGGVFG